MLAVDGNGTNVAERLAGTRRKKIMTDFGDTLASDAAQEIVKILAGGLAEAVKKIASLWRRAGARKQELIEAEVQRSSAALLYAGADLAAARARQEGAWEGRLRDLLAEHPEVAKELRDMLEEIRRQTSRLPQAVQTITASAPGATAQGAMFGDVINHGDPLRPAAPKVPPSTESGDRAQRDDRP
jgi:hypothetical protein